ncbi:MAG: CHAT domain-containing protein [Acidobacteria bacterium]|nr:CHAT domain-containing protein [Acidobacteriota bacterium]
MFQSVHTGSLHRTHLGIIGAFGLLTAYALQAQSSAESGDPTQKLLVAGQTFTRSLVGGKTHTYSVDLVTGQFLHIVVEQRGIDLIVKIVGMNGGTVAEVDRPNGLQGPEAVSLVAQESGEYRILVIPASKRAPAGNYRVIFHQLRQSQPLDRMRIEAEQAVSKGELLRPNHTVEAKREAISQFERALGIWRTLGESYEEAVALYGLGLSHREIGENKTAANHFKRALTIMRLLGDRYGEAINQTGLAWSYLYLGATDKALDNFSQSLRLRYAVNDRSGEALTLYGIGWAHANKGDPEKALDYFLQSLQLRRELGDRRAEAVTLVGISQIYGQLQRQHEALPHLRRALTIVRELDDRYFEADTFDKLGWTSLALDEVSTANDYFQQALPLRRMVGDRIGEATVLFGLARIEYRQGRLLSARERIEASLALIESSRTEAAIPQFRTTFFASVVHYYQFAIKILMRLHEQEPSSGYAAMALRMNERMRARSLLDLLAEARAELRSDAPAHLLERDHALRREINLIADRRIRGRATAADSVKLDALMNQYEEIQARIRDANPRYAALTQPVTLNLADLQQHLLDDNTLLLEYSLGEECSYLWAVTSTSLDSYVLPGRDEIEPAVHRLLSLIGEGKRRAIQQPVKHDQAIQSFNEAAASLSQMLLGPVAAQLKNKRLVIIADGALQYAPFAALPAPTGTVHTTGNDPEVITSYRQLVADHEIVSLPSASVLASLRRQRDDASTAPKTIAVFADPVFEITDPRVNITDSRKIRLINVGRASRIDTVTTDADSAPPRLLRLPFTRRAASAVIPLVAPDQRLLALDFAANRATATSAELAQYRIIHFATHSLFNREHPELSGIALSLVDKQGRPQNGFLRLHEIYNLKLGADLVVLSACQTGLGKEVKGEGLIGLTRGFMYAGAPSVVATLWKVDDKATAELMKHFYQALLGEQRMRPAAALRAAQIALWSQKRWRDPAYWAAFTLHGEWQ